VFIEMLRPQWIGNRVLFAKPFSQVNSLQRREQNGPYFPANDSPVLLQVGDLTITRYFTGAF